METWLRTNTRAVLVVVVATAIVLGGGLLALGYSLREPSGWLRIVAAAIVIVAAVAIALLLLELRRPRMAYRQGELLLWLRGARPIRVPIEVVECFWLGQAPSLLPGKRHEHTETAAIVIRIAERAAEWRHQEVKPQLGSWCEGYVTIRGTWCEPLSIDVVNRLNRRLAEVTGRSTVAGSSAG